MITSPIRLTRRKPATTNGEGTSVPYNPMVIEKEFTLELVVDPRVYTDADSHRFPNLIVPRFAPDPSGSLDDVDTMPFFEQYDALIQFVTKTNKTVGSYHNTHHLIGVAWLTYVLSELTGVRTHQRALVTAALFHDYHHPAGYDDVSNISATLKAMDDSGIWDSKLISPRRADVEFIIRQTQWPLPDNLQLTREGELLRDADQLYATYFFDLTLSERLFSELGPRFGCTSRSEWLVRNVEYALSLRNGFYWPVSDSMFDASLNKAINLQVKQLADLCAR